MPNEQTDTTPAAQPQGVHLVGSVPLANMERLAFEPTGLAGKSTFLRRIRISRSSRQTPIPMLHYSTSGCARR